MEFKPIKQVKKHSEEFVYKFDQKPKDSEYIALPTQCKKEHVTFQKAMKLTVLIGQLFGLNPVIGVCDDDVSKLRFVYSSSKYFFSVLSVFAQVVLVCFYLFKIFWENKGTSLISHSGLVFFGCNCVMTIQFIIIATKWPQLSRHIAKLEDIDPNEDHTLVWKCNITSLLIILLGIVEHILSELSGISVAQACQPDKNAYDAFLIANFSWIWAYVPYNTFLGMSAQLISIQCTFIWNYSDGFIMCMCWYLIARLQQVNDRLREVTGQTMPQYFWRTLREDYTKATNLVRRVDEIVNGVIFVSFVSNVLSICFLLLHVLQDGLTPNLICNVPSEKRLVGSYVHATFYIFSVSFLILRSLIMSLLAARVNSASTEAAYALYEVPFDAYNVEVQRFIDQVHGDSTVLSGLQFFGVKRGIVLTIAATIVTYELVLLQFSSL